MYLQSHFLSVKDKKSFLREYGSISFFSFQSILTNAPGSISEMDLTIEKSPLILFLITNSSLMLSQKNVVFKVNRRRVDKTNE